MCLSMRQQGERSSYESFNDSSDRILQPLAECALCRDYFCEGDCPWIGVEGVCCCLKSAPPEGRATICGRKITPWDMAKDAGTLAMAFLALAMY